MDVSFISVTILLPVVTPLLARPAEAVVLVKPQFEAGRAAVGKGGVVRDPAAREAAVERVRTQMGQLGWQALQVVPSPLLGAEGNQEYLLHGRLG